MSSSIANRESTVYVRTDNAENPALPIDVDRWTVTTEGWLSVWRGDCRTLYPPERIAKVEERSGE